MLREQYKDNCMTPQVGKIGSLKSRLEVFQKTEELRNSTEKNKPKDIKNNINGISQEDLNTYGVFGAVWNKDKELAGANGASAAGAPTQPTAAADNGTNNKVDNAVNNDNNNTELNANATGHTAQTQATATPSGLTATQGGDNTDNQGDSTDGNNDNNAVPQNIQQTIDDMYQEAIKVINQVETGEEVPAEEDVPTTGEGMLSTGAAEGADGTGEVNGALGASGTAEINGVSQQPEPGDVKGPNNANPNDPANQSDNPNKTDTSNNSPRNIRKQEDQQQERVLNERFRKLNDDEAA